jgi:hypothetical protein
LKCHCSICSMRRTPILNRFLTQFWYGNIRKPMVFGGPQFDVARIHWPFNCHRLDRRPASVFASSPPAVQLGTFQPRSSRDV